MKKQFVLPLILGCGFCVLGGCSTSRNTEADGVVQGVSQVKKGGPTLHPWRDDPNLAAHFHPQFPDDVQVFVHDGETRRTNLEPEGCWVSIKGVKGTARFPIASMDSDVGDPRDVTWVERTIYRGKLLNQPHRLKTLRAGDEVYFIYSPGVPLPLYVTEDYLRERQSWAVLPCDRCGADQTLDPPSTMYQTRFPNAPRDAQLEAFTAFCQCGGTMALSKLRNH